MRRENCFLWAGILRFAFVLLWLFVFRADAQAQLSQVVSWGYNGYGQTNTPASLTNAVQVDGGETYTLALRSDGRLVGWGDNYYGTVTPPADLSNVVAFVCGGYFNVALRADGTVAAFGNPDFSRTNVPAGLSNVVAVAAGSSHTLALLRDGSLRSWGGPNDFAKTNIPVALSNVTAIAAGMSHNMALRSDGRVVAWGDNNHGQTDVPIGLSNVVAISAGFFQNYALRADGSLVAWGRSSDGSNFIPISVPASATNLTQIGVGNYHALGLRPSGDILTWGYDSNLGANNPPGSLSNVVAVAGGGYQSVAIVATNLLYLPNRLPDVAIHEGGTLHLRVAPITSTAPRYQWSRNGLELSGQTNAALVVPALAGLYSVTVSNAAGLVISDDANVSVLPFWIVTHPTNQVRYLGGSVTFIATVLGEGLTYQWQRSGTNLSGATQASLTLTNLQSSQTGDYSLLVSNALGSASSLVARLDVVNVAAWGRNLERQTELHPGLTNVVSVQAGANHNLVLRRDGSVFAWGDNNYAGTTNLPAGLTDVAAIAAGGMHNLVLRSNGTLLAWGDNNYSQTNLPSWLSNVVTIAAGGYNSAAINSDGQLFAWWGGTWGYGNVIGGASNMVDVSCTWAHTLGLRADGRVFGWGDNHYGQTSVPAGLSNVVALAAGGGFNVVLRSDGTVLAWGYNANGQTNVPPGLSNVVAIAAGGSHALAQRADGSVVWWGSTNFNQTPPSDLPGVAEIAGGSEHSVALIGSGPPHLLKGLPDRNVAAGATAFFQVAATGQPPLQHQWRCYGTNLPGATNAWFALPNLQPAQAGLYSLTVSNAWGGVTSREAMLGVTPLFITAELTNQIRNAGSPVTMQVGVEGAGPFLYQWRFNGAPLSGATNAVLELGNAQPEQAGLYSVVIANQYGALTSAVMQLELPWVAMWGRYSEGSRPLPNWFTNIVAVAEGAAHTLALRPDGTVSAWGFNNFGQTNIPVGLSDVRSLSAGTYFSVALRSNGTVTAWGRSDLGSLNVPAGLNGVLAISAGGGHTLALRTNGTVTAWGYNSDGQVNVPAGLSNVVAVAGGGDHSVALRADGTVAAWGETYGQAYVPLGLSDVVAISAGYYHSLALRANGTVAAWGVNYYGQLNLPAGLTNIVAIAAAAYHNIALRADGAVICWGDSDLGQTAVPAGLTNVAGIFGGGPTSLALLGAGAPYARTRVAARTVLAGGQTIFYAEGSGARPLFRQWQLNGTDISGATNAWLVLTNVLPPQAGAYACVFTNRYGMASTEPGILTVQPLQILAPPKSQTQFGGGAVLFSVGVGGPGPFTYQWRCFGTNLPGATNANLALTDLQLAQSGPYSVAVSNVWGGIVSAAASLTVVPILVTAPPQGGTNYSGTNVTFSVVALGLGPLSYQWQRNGVDIAGATSATLLLANVQSVQSGDYAVRITNSYGEVTTQPVSLEVRSVVAVGLAYDSNVTGVPRGSNLVAVAAGSTHSLALRGDGTVIAWGDSNYNYGQLNVPPGLADIAAIACGAFHNLALRSNGTVVAWGRNNHGQTNVPPGLSNVVAIAAGEAFNLALRGNGTVVAWAGDSDILTNVPAGLDKVVAIAAGSSHSLALRADGSFAFWGYGGYGWDSPPPGLSNVVSVAAGFYYSLALQADGTVKAWGYNAQGQTNVPPGLSNVIAIAAGGYHGLALLANRTAVAWGYNYSGQTNSHAGLVNIAAIAGGGSHSLFLLGDGAPRLQTPLLARTTLAGERVYFHAAISGAGPLSYQWRFNGTNLLGATNLTLVRSNVPVAFAGDYSLVVSNPFGVLTTAVATLTIPPLQIVSPPQSLNTYRGNGVQFNVAVGGAGPFTYQWQFNGADVPGATNSSLALAALHLQQSGAYAVVVSNSYGAITSAPAQLDVGLVAAWGDNTYGQTNLRAGLQDARAVSTTMYDSAVLNEDGSIRIWGGTATTMSLTNIPAEVQPAKAIASGGGWLVALRTNGTVAAWGVPSHNSCTNVPMGLSNVVAVAANTWHGLALRANGTVVGWGYNLYQQVNPPAGLSNVVAIACGAENSLAVRADGTVEAWGGNRVGQSSVPADLTNAVAIAAGNIHALALRADGRVLGWGYNQYGQTNTPVSVSNAVAIAAGWQHSLAVQNDGRLLAWGDDAAGQTNVPTTVSNVVSAAGGYQHSLALVAGGKPFLQEDLADRSVLAGGKVFFAIKASGEWPLHYQWKLHGTNLPGATNAVLALRDVLLEQAGPYAVTVSNALGQVTSDPAGLTVEPLRFLSQPANRTQYAGGSTTFSFVVEGFGPFSYQWQRFGTNLPGATNADLALTTLQFAQAGPYSVVVSNVAGAVTSSAAQLTIVPMIITSQPQSRAVTVGATTNLSIAVSGAPLLRFQWRLQGTNLPGATNATLALPNVQFNQAGDYTVVITNGYGVVTSQVATVTVRSILVFAATYAGIGPLTNVIEAIAFSAGGNHALALRPDRTVFGWGNNTYGQITIPASATNVLAVAAGINHSLALRTNGTVIGWGRNEYSQATIPVAATNVVAIAAGETHSLALRANGSIVAWGYSGNGQTTIPIGLTNVVAIDAGAQHSLALRADGTLSAWGNNSQGQITIPASATNVIAIAAGNFYNLALRADGTVVAWGQASYSQTIVPAGLSNVVAIAAGSTDSLALRADGTVRGWGYTLGHDTAMLSGGSNFVAIAAGNDFGLLLGGSGAPFVLDGLPDRAAFSLGAFSFKANASGQRPLHYQWTHNGLDLPGATNSLLRLSDPMPAQAGAYALRVSNLTGVVTSRVAFFKTSEVITWGRYYNGTSNALAATIAGLTNIIAVAAGEDHGVALRSNGTVVAWGNSQYGQLSVPGAVQFQTALVAAGGNHALALLTNGTVRAWGRNSYGQSVVPAGLSNVVALAAGREHSLALKFDGSVIGWGRNFEGQTNVPAGLGEVVGIAAAANYSLAVRADGTVVGWGNSVGTNRPAGLTNVMALAAGLQHVLALRGDGRVTAWGSGAPTNVPAGLSNVVAIAAGEQHSFALRADGRVVAWGGAANVLSQTNVPTNLSNVVALASGAEMGLALVGSGKPAVTLPAVHHLTAPGAQAQLQVFAVGAGLTYQWQRDGVNLTGATNRLLQLSGDAYSGVYRVVVSNAFGVTLSRGSVVTAIPVFEMTAGTGLTTNGFQLRLVGLSGHNYVILLASTNLADWTPLHTNLPVLGSFDYLDRTSTNFAQRFYRATESDLALGPLRITSLQPAVNGAVQLDVAGLTGLGPVWVWASSNLLDWQPVLTNPPQIGPGRFTEGAGDGHPIRFYRVQEQR